jgi:hypothetical protein
MHEHVVRDIGGIGGVRCSCLGFVRAHIVYKNRQHGNGHDAPLLLHIGLFAGLVKRLWLLAGR